MHQQSASTTDFARILGTPCPEALSPVLAAGQQALIMPGHLLLAVYADTQGRTAAMPADALAWLSDTSDMPELNAGESYGKVRYYAQDRESPRSVILMADVIRTVKPSQRENGTYIPAVTESLAPRIVGAIMTHKV